MSGDGVSADPDELWRNLVGGGPNERFREAHQGTGRRW